MSSFLTAFALLCCTHLLLDFYWQPDAWVQAKNRYHQRSIKLALHAILHGLATAAVLQYLYANTAASLCGLVIISLSHWLIDLYKSYQQRSSSRLSWFMIDQALHLGILAIISLHASGLGIMNLLLRVTEPSPGLLLILTAFLVILKPSSILVGLVLTKYSPLDDQQPSGLKAGGELIGYLERCLILMFILLGQYSVIGFILAAKSIFRFGDLNKASEKNLTEYVLLGTLFSVTLTASVGLLVVYLLG